MRLAAMIERNCPPRAPPRKPAATGRSPRVLSSLATLTDLPAAPSRVVTARLTASRVSLRKSMTRWAAGVVPRQRIIEGRFRVEADGTIKIEIKIRIKIKRGERGG